MSRQRSRVPRHPVAPVVVGDLDAEADRPAAVCDLSRARWVRPDGISVVYAQEPDDGSDLLVVLVVASGAATAVALTAENALMLGDSLCDASEALPRLRAEHIERMRPNRSHLK